MHIEETFNFDKPYENLLRKQVLISKVHMQFNLKGLIQPHENLYLVNIQKYEMDNVLKSHPSCTAFKNFGWTNVMPTYLRAAVHKVEEKC